LALLRALGPILDRVNAAGTSARQPGEPCPAERVLAQHDQRVRILLIRPDHLGDALLAAPTGVALRVALPAARIDWLVGPWAAEVVERAGRPNEILTCEFPGFARRPKRSPWEPYGELVRQARRLRVRRYDIALVLRPDHWWGALLTAAAGIPRRLGYRVPECRPFLTDALAVDRGGHAVERGLALARLAARLVDPSAEAARIEPTFSVHAEERAWASARLAAAGVGDDSPLVAIHPGSGAAVKNWLPRRWREVATALQRDLGISLVLTGGTAEAGLLGDVAAALEPPPALVVAGETTLGQLGALFARCDLVLGGDSGPLHLAAAVGTATVRLYGPTDSAQFGPRGDAARQRVVEATLPCQPCGNIVAPPCGAISAPACLRMIPTEQVVAEAEQVLALGMSPPPLAPRLC